MLFRRTFIGRDQPCDCPDPSRLRDLLDEALTAREQADLTAHIDACAACQRRLEEVAGGPLLAATVPERLGPSLARVMDELRQAPPADATQPEPAGDVPVLDFLEGPADAARPGRFGNYEVQEVLGRGGMGVVLEAFDPALHRVVAIKVLAPQLAVSGAARQRFAREARAAAAVCHEHVVPIYAVDSAHGLPYLVMQYVPGQSLQERLDRDGPLPLEQVLRIGMQTAAGLAAAHAQGLIHRDIKPANLLLENGVERVKLTDFSLARAVDDASMTRSGFVAGTPAYMAPEQARGDSIDARADLFSLGSVIYAMCTGHAPFRAGSTLALLRRVSEEQAPPLQDSYPNIPDWMDRLMKRLHAKDPAQRFASAREASEALGACLAHVQNPRLNPLPAWLLPRPKPAPRRGLQLLLLAACALVTLMLGMGVVTRVNTPQGTLIIEVEDPDVQVTVDGQTVTLNGKNVGEVVLKPGTYKVEVNKEGKPQRTQVVQIERGGKTLVTVTLDPKLGAVAKDEPKKDHPQGPSALDPPAVEPAALPAHYRAVTALNFSSDSKYLLSGSADGTVQLYTTHDAKVVGEVDHGESPVVTATFLSAPNLFLTLSKDGQMKLCAAEEATDKKGRVTTAVKILTTVNLKVTIDRADVVGAGNRVMGAHDDVVRVWDVETGKEKEMHKIPLQGTEWKLAPDGRRLAVVEERGISVWSWERERPAVVWQSGKAEKRPTPSLAFSPDGKLLFSSSGGETTAWDAGTGKKIGTLFQGETPAVSPDGKTLATVGREEKLRLWDVATGKEIRSVALPRSARITHLAFSPDGKWLAWAASDGKVFLLALGTAATGGAGEKLPGESRDPDRNAKELRLYAEQLLKAQEAWQKREGAAEKLLDRGPKELRGLEWAILKRLVERGEGGKPFFQGKQPIRGVGVTADGRLAAIMADDSHLRLRDVASAKDLILLSALKVESLEAFAFSPDGKRAVTLGDDHLLYYWDLESGKMLRAATKVLQGARSVEFSPDGKHIGLAGAREGKLFYGIYNAETGKVLQTINEEAVPPKGEYVGLLTYAPDGRFVATAGDKDFKVRITNVDSTFPVATLEGHKETVRGLAFSPDAKLLATASDDGTVKVWAAETGKLLMSLQHKDAVRAVCFSKDGVRVIAGTKGGEVYFWDAASGQKVLALPAHDGAVNTLAVSPDNKVLFSGGQDGKVHAWGK